MDLFNQNRHIHAPLAEILRPKNIDEVFGQESTIGPKSKLGKLLRAGHIPSMILWGPPGTGKTSFALALANQTNAAFEVLNAVEAGVKILREKGEQGRDRRLQTGQKTLLFVDEIHRFNKSQQDVLLPFMEKGDVIVVGATTENPSYELNRAILSRTRVVVFEPLSEANFQAMLSKAEQSLGCTFKSFTEPDVFPALIEYADGDGRRFLNSIEVLFKYHQLDVEEVIKVADLAELLNQSTRAYDKNSEFHYDIISAFIKSIRGSDADAAVYYLARMLDGGEDPVFIARRLIILASEDIGNADPRALTLAVSGLQALEAIGLPEGAIVLSQVATYLANCPKSNAAYIAINQAKSCVAETGSLPVPLHLRSSKTEMSKSLGYGVDYKYPHSFPKGWVAQQYMPESLKGRAFYEPKRWGFEKTILEFIEWLKK